jgi:preprotein translocase subunit SecB
MEQPIHPIVLDRVFFTRSIVVATPDHEPGDGPLSIAPENKIDVALVKEGDEPRRYIATMQSVLNSGGDKSSPYTIDMECVGMFIIVDKSLSPEEAVHAVMITAHSVLYGAIREAVAWITGRQPYGQLMLGLSVLRPKPADDKAE